MLLHLVQTSTWSLDRHACELRHWLAEANNRSMGHSGQSCCCIGFDCVQGYIVNNIRNNKSFGQC